MKILVKISLFCLLSVNAWAQQPIKNFTNGSYEQIVKQYQQQAFVMVLWSLDCPPCYKELEELGKEKQQHDINLVLISVDGIDASNDVFDVLKEYDLQDVDSWLFDEHSSQQLRYEIDPLWYGELPRSYLYDKQHRRQAISGVLSAKQLLK